MTSVSDFHRLSNDALAPIAELTGIAAIAQLWCCGDSIFNQKLAASVRVCRYLGFGHEKIPFPGCIKHLSGLQEFSYSLSYMHQCDTTALTKDSLNNLPSSLTKLSISGPQWFSFWLPGILRDKNTEWDSVRDYFKNPANQKVKMNLRERFPVLVSLELTNAATFKPTFNFFEFSELPSSLTRLWAPHYSNRSILASLPVSLVELSLGIDQVTISDIENFSRLTSLETLSLQLASGFQAEFTHLLPPSLVVLDTTIMEGPTDGNYEKSPVGLQSIYICRHGIPSNVNFLPRGITSLQLYILGIIAPEKGFEFSAFFLSLPRSMKSLIMEFPLQDYNDTTLKISPSDLESLPPNLETLKLSIPKWTASFVQVLPKTITALLIHSNSLEND
jgi:hypothetical protein